MKLHVKMISKLSRDSRIIQIVVRKDYFNETLLLKDNKETLSAMKVCY